MGCIQCGVEHERKGMYCSKKCTDKAYRERKKAAKSLEETPEENEVELIIDIPDEKGEKQRWCNFCGASIENSSKLGFCDTEHEKNYWLAIRLELPLKIKIDSKTIVETRRYYKVQEIIQAMINRNKFGVTFF